MRNVKRLPKPSSLSKNSLNWTKTLLAEIIRCNKCGERVLEKFYSKYNKKDIRDALNKMYDNCCCYCESKLGIVDYSHIEHRKPKRGTPPNNFPQFCFDWDNLHLSCTRCNVSKGDKFDSTNPILDAIADTNIETHFIYQLGVDSDLLWYPTSHRANTTLKHTDLNRSELAKARLSVFKEVLNQIIAIKANPGNPGNAIVLSELRKKANGHSSYGSVIKFLLTNQAVA